MRETSILEKEDTKVLEKRVSREKFSECARRVKDKALNLIEEKFEGFSFHN